jgi:hypothetical protein
MVSRNNIAIHPIRQPENHIPFVRAGSRRMFWLQHEYRWRTDRDWDGHDQR